ncbi:MAG: demethylmenaquinone methyltransferase [Candidatus Micrarchaeota archaeon]|nr:MAG: demethylmenaquinone methyltransferase [Candidatus Micrarchaeota archaeon]
MFNRIADRYEIANTIFSFGLDKYFRAKAAEIAIKPNEIYKILDTATGTGNLITELLRRAYSVNSKIEIYAIDQSSKMLNVARRRFNGLSNVHIYRMDALHTSFKDESFDLITNSMALRNFDDRLSFLKESYRLLKRKGRLVILDTAIPDSLACRIFFEIYSRLILLEGYFIDKDAYKFMIDSIRRQRRDEVLELCYKAGFSKCNIMNLFSEIPFIIEAFKI